jgi:1-acyl-sn-glycerol-3-phosphate acyltransferase
VIGIFPKGGIWNDKKKRAKTGNSWLSYKSGAPVIPVAFIGMKCSLKKASSFRNQKLKWLLDRQ